MNFGGERSQRQNLRRLTALRGSGLLCQDCRNRSLLPRFNSTASILTRQWQRVDGIGLQPPAVEIQAYGCLGDPRQQESFGHRRGHRSGSGGLEEGAPATIAPPLGVKMKTLGKALRDIV
ncbi:MAG: hypothetical protein K7J46_10225 [Bryobacter sp.]|nr:hypothetical protein [Bryobacter sp. CoA8 C33]